jgi:hypothetical protein
MLKLPRQQLVKMAQPKSGIIDLTGATRVSQAVASEHALP